MSITVTAILLATLLLRLSADFVHRCTYQHPQHIEIGYSQPDMDLQRQKRNDTSEIPTPVVNASFEPMRIIHYIYEKDFKDKSPLLLVAVKRTMQKVESFFENLLRVRPLLNGVYIEVSECEDGKHDGDPIPPEYLKIKDGAACASRPFHQADMLLLITARTRSTCKGSTLATARPKWSLYDKRPYVGEVNICPEKIMEEKHSDYTLEATLKHELMHAFGFGDLKSYNTTKGTYRWTTDENPQGYDHEAEFVTTTKVMEAMKKHSGCQTIMGAEIEQEGGEETAGSHWDKRVFGPELMTGVISGRTYFSEMSMALLEDTGWYLRTTNQSFLKTVIEPLPWGNGLGCNFYHMSCKGYSEEQQKANKSTYPWCTRVDYVSQKDMLNSLYRKRKPWLCSPDHSAVLYCDLYSKDDLPIPEEYTPRRHQYVGDPALFGTDLLASFCPAWQSIRFAQGRARKGDSSCLNPDNEIAPMENIMAESYGNSSICVNQNKEKFFNLYECKSDNVLSTVTAKMGYTGGAGCYDYKCAFGRLHIRPGGKSRYLTCYGKGTILEVGRSTSNATHKGRQVGELICPSCEEICTHDDTNFKCDPSVPGLNVADLTESTCADGTGYIRLALPTMLLIAMAHMLRQSSSDTYATHMR